MATVTSCALPSTDEVTAGTASDVSADVSVENTTEQVEEVEVALLADGDVVATTTTSLSPGESDTVSVSGGYVFPRTPGEVPITTEANVLSTSPPPAEVYIEGPTDVVAGEPQTYFVDVERGEIRNPSWTFPDGSTVTGDEANYTFEDSGLATVEFDATDASDGMLLEAFLNVDVTLPDSGTSDEIEIQGPTTLTEGSRGTWSVPDGSGPFAATKWEMSDGWTREQTGEISRTFRSPGEYRITFTGENPGGDPVVGTLDIAIIERRF